MKFILSSLRLWLPAIHDKPNIFKVCKSRIMFWEALNGVLYLDKDRYVGIKGSIFEPTDNDEILDILRNT